MATKVADLFGALGLRVNKQQWAEGNKAISGLKQAALGIGAVFAGKALGKSLISFNSNVEDSKNKIAGMLALTKKTDLSAELANANTLMTNLQKRAAKLPGTTTEYVNMLGMLTQPVTDAGLGMKDLEDLTVNAVVAAKGLGVEWEVAARDIDQAIRGQFKSTDQLTGKLLGSVGFKGEAGRAKFNAMSAKDRAATLKAALGQKQIVQLAEAQGNTFSGVLSTLKDASEQFLGKVGIPLFKALGDAIRGANVFLTEHADEVAAVADVIGSVLVGAFDAIKTVLTFLTDGSDESTAVLIGIGVAILSVVVPALYAMAAGWIAALWPLALIVAVVAGIIIIVKKIGPAIKKGFRAALDWCAGKAQWLADKVMAAGGAIKGFFVGIGSSIKAFFTGVVDWILQKIEDIKAGILGAAKYVNDSWIGKVTRALSPAAAASTAMTPAVPSVATPSVAVRGGGVPGAGGMTSVVNNMTINVPDGMSPQKVGDIVNEKITNQFRGALADRGQR